MFKEKMQTPAIPERVYTLCKIVQKGPISKVALQKRMEPDYLDQKSDYFNDYFNAAEELSLVSVSDNMVFFSAKDSVLESFDSFRKYVNSKIYAFSNGEFYAVTRAYFALNENILIGKQNVAELPEVLNKISSRKVDAKSMRAWRFWASFLGFGYLHNMLLLPNADVFLKDVIEFVGFDKGIKYSFGDFINKLSPYANIIIQADSGDNSLNYGVSCGLRTLHDQGVITLEHILDQEDIWSLYTMKSHSIVTTVTNITIH